jgi:ankyrin repeat protein
MYASDQGRVNVARLLLEHGADVNAQNNSQDTPLHRVALGGFPDSDVARLLVEHGANIHAENNEGRTASQVALARGRYNIAKILSDHDST